MTRFVLSEEQIPTRVVQRAAGHAGAAAAAAASCDARADRARRPRAALPDGAHRPGGVDRPVDRHPRRGPRHPPPLAADAARARRAARGRARHAGAHLLQGRVGLARGLAQAQHRRRRRPSTTRPRASQRLTTETGAGQWGSALAFACAQFGLECKVYMVRASYDQKPYRKILMETWGGEVVPSPVDEPDHPGFARARDQRRGARRRRRRDDSHYSLGSVLNHVLLHQTVIGLEAKEQLALAGERRPTSSSARAAADRTSAASRCRS